MSPRVLNSFCVPAGSSSSQRNGEKFQPEALLKKNHMEFCQVGLFLCLCLCASLCFRKSEKDMGSNSFLPSRALFERDILKRSTFLLGPGSLNNQFEMVVSVGMIPNHCTNKCLFQHFRPVKNGGFEFPDVSFL